MENPATWGPAERIIDKILGELILETAKPPEERRIGLSWTMSPQDNDETLKVFLGDGS